MAYVEAAAKSVRGIKRFQVILESTSPVGATERMAGWLAGMRRITGLSQQAGEQADVNIAYCPGAVR